MCITQQSVVPCTREEDEGGVFYGVKQLTMLCSAIVAFPKIEALVPM